MHRLLLVLFILFIFSAPVYAQDGVTDGERIARIESRLDANEQHLATKADIANLRTDLVKQIGEIRISTAESLLVQTRWMIGVGFGLLMALIGSWASIFFQLRK